jgi:hypothetical protein
MIQLFLRTLALDLIVPVSPRVRYLLPAACSSLKTGSTVFFFFFSSPFVL